MVNVFFVWIGNSTTENAVWGYFLLFIKTQMQYKSTN